MGTEIPNLVTRLFDESTPIEESKRIQERLYSMRREELKAFYLGLAGLGMEFLTSVPITQFECVGQVDVLYS